MFTMLQYITKAMLKTAEYMTIFNVLEQRQPFLVMNFVYQCINLRLITQIKLHFHTRASLEQQN